MFMVTSPWNYLISELSSPKHREDFIVYSVCKSIIGVPSGLLYVSCRLAGKPDCYYSMVSLSKIMSYS
jgi:hypothetical protein